MRDLRWAGKRFYAPVMTPQELDAADALLVVGSSLMVFSGYRFVKAAAAASKPVAAINLGRTRADAEIGLKITAPCGEALAAVERQLVARQTVEPESA